ncbi:MAG: hypothetical protein Q4D98_01010 [Planctomycetia bacterium]|nr:hypothetical protein [Planctomycetia bacterium]
MKKLGIVVILAMLLVWDTGCFKRKDYSAGKKVISEIESAKSISDPGERASQLARLAVSQNELLKDAKGASLTISLADKACGEITDPMARVGAYSSLSESYVKLGRSSGARQALKKAKTAIEEMPESTSPEERVEAFVGLASAQGAVGGVNDATASLESAYALIDKMESDISKIDTMIKIANGYCSMKVEASRDEMFAKLIETADASDNQRTRCDIYCRLAEIQYQNNLKELADKTLKTAVEIVEKIDGLGAQAMTLCQIAQVCITANDKTQARTYVKDADKRSGKEKDNSLRMAAQERVADMKSKLDMQ